MPRCVVCNYDISLKPDSEFYEEYHAGCTRVHWDVLHSHYICDQCDHISQETLGELEREGET